MTLEEAKSVLEQEKRLCMLYGRNQFIGNIEAIDTVLKALDDSIPKEKIRDRLRLFQDNSLGYMNLVLFQSIMELLGE